MFGGVCVCDYYPGLCRPLGFITMSGDRPLLCAPQRNLIGGGGLLKNVFILFCRFLLSFFLWGRLERRRLIGDGIFTMDVCVTLFSILLHAA